MGAGAKRKYFERFLTSTAAFTLGMHQTPYLFVPVGKVDRVRLALEPLDHCRGRDNSALIISSLSSLPIAHAYVRRE